MEFALKGRLCPEYGFSDCAGRSNTEYRLLSTHSRSRMRLIIRLLEAFGRYMGVDLSCRKVGMTEQGLNAAQIRTVVQEVSSEAVPELVRARRKLNGGCTQILLEEEPG